MFSKEKAEGGDILLYRPKKDDMLGLAINFFQFGGVYSHASVYIGDGMIIESHAKSGVVEIPLEEKYYGIIYIYRVNGDLTPNQAGLLTNWLRGKVGSGYDGAALPSTYFRSKLSQIFGWKNFRKDRPLINDPNKFYCSELVATAYMEALKYNLRPDMNVMSVTPTDLGNSLSLKEVV